MMRSLCILAAVVSSAVIARAEANPIYVGPLLHAHTTNFTPRPPTQTATASGVPTRTLSAPCACPGDLDGDGSVTISELVSAVNAAVSGCPK